MLSRYGSLCSLCALTLVTLLPAAVQAESNWTQFRGPNATGIVTGADLPTKITAADYRWQIDMPGLGHGSPVLFENRLYVTSEVDGEKQRQVLCVDPADGRIVWAHEEPYEEAQGHHRLNSFAASTPAVDANGIYVSWISGEDFVLFALDHTGEERWRKTIPCGFASKFGPGASPIVLDGIVIMGNEHAGSKCFLMGVDSKSGDVVWEVARKTGLASYCTPKVYRPEGGPVQLIFASTAHGVTSVDAATGKVLWEVPCHFEYKTCATPVIADGVVFVSAGRGSAGVETVAVRLPDVTAGQQPEIVYRSESRLPYVPTPLAFDGKFVLWNDAGIVTCIEAATGSELWNGKVSGSYFSSPLLINGRIYNVSRTGELVVLATDRFAVLAEHALPEGAHATPAVIGNRMYVRTFGKLICIGS